MRVRNDEAELRQLTSLAINGLLRSYVYWIGDKPAAFAVGNQHGGCFRYEETGFNPEFRHYSPGRTMLLEILSDLQKHDPVRVFDFGFGDAEYKQQFTNRESRSGTVWLVPPGLRARLMLSHLNVCRQFRSAVYTQIKRSGLGTMVRQWIRSPRAAGTAVIMSNAEQATPEFAK
jgi:CelD/BcsL family acetyltransferase involved in cellulose biosynthesis